MKLSRRERKQQHKTRKEVSEDICSQCNRTILPNELYEFRAGEPHHVNITDCQPKDYDVNGC